MLGTWVQQCSFGEPPGMSDESRLDEAILLVWKNPVFTYVLSYYEVRAFNDIKSTLLGKG